MTGIEGTTPAPTWQVKRRWMPRLGHDTVWGRFHRRYRKAFRRVSDTADADPGCLEIFGEGLVAGIVVLIAVLLVLFVGIPLFVAVFDLVLLLLLAIGGLVARVLFNRPWLIEARDGSATVLRWRVVGWRASRERVEEIRQQLDAGIRPPDVEVIVQPRPK